MNRTLTIRPGVATIPSIGVSAGAAKVNQGAVSLGISFVGCTLLTAAFLVRNPQVVHWFVIPTLFCGILSDQTQSTGCAVV